MKFFILLSILFSGSAARAADDGISIGEFTKVVQAWEARPKSAVPARVKEGVKYWGRCVQYSTNRSSVTINQKAILLRMDVDHDPVRGDIVSAAFSFAPYDEAFSAKLGFSKDTVKFNALSVFGDGESGAEVTTSGGYYGSTRSYVAFRLGDGNPVNLYSRIYFSDRHTSTDNYCYYWNRPLVKPQE